MTNGAVTSASRLRWGPKGEQTVEGRVDTLIELPSPTEPVGHLPEPVILSLYPGAQNRRSAVSRMLKITILALQFDLPPYVYDRTTGRSGF